MIALYTITAVHDAFSSGSIHYKFNLVNPIEQPGRSEGDFFFSGTGSPVTEKDYPGKTGTGGNTKPHHAASH